MLLHQVFPLSQIDQHQQGHHVVGDGQLAVPRPTFLAPIVPVLVLMNRWLQQEGPRQLGPLLSRLRLPRSLRRRAQMQASRMARAALMNFHRFLPSIDDYKDYDSDDDNDSFCTAVSHF